MAELILGQVQIRKSARTPSLSVAMSNYIFVLFGTIQNVQISAVLSMDICAYFISL